MLLSLKQLARIVIHFDAYCCQKVHTEGKASLNRALFCKESALHPLYTGASSLVYIQRPLQPVRTTLLLATTHGTSQLAVIRNWLRDNDYQEAGDAFHTAIQLITIYKRAGHLTPTVWKGDAAASLQWPNLSLQTSLAAPQSGATAYLAAPHAGDQPAEEAVITCCHRFVSSWSACKFYWY